MPKKTKTTAKKNDKTKQPEKPAQDKKQKKETTTQNQTLGISETTKIIIAIIIIVIAVFLITSFQKTTHEKGLEDWCKKIENHPYLNYECRCVPLKDTEDSQKDEVEKKTEPKCRCICDIGNGTLWTTDIRAAK